MDGKTSRVTIETCGLSEPPRENMRVRDGLLALLNELIERLIELGLEEQDEGKAMKYFAPQSWLDSSSEVEKGVL